MLEYKKRTIGPTKCARTKRQGSEQERASKVGGEAVRGHFHPIACINVCMCAVCARFNSLWWPAASWCMDRTRTSASCKRERERDKRPRLVWPVNKIVSELAAARNASTTHHPFPFGSPWLGWPLGPHACVPGSLFLPAIRSQNSCLIYVL